MNDIEDTVEAVRRDTYALATPAGRLPGTAGHEAARDLIEARFDDLGLAGLPSLDGFRHHYVDVTGTESANLIGVVRGERSDLAPVLIGAHYDSVIPAPSADDNAAGVAVMLEVASRLASDPLRRDTLVVAFDTEEPPNFLGPGMGSNRLVEDVLTDEVHLAVVLDLIGHPVTVPGLPLDPAALFVAGAESHPSLPGLLAGLSLPLAATAQHRVGDFSDYAAFRLSGAPYLFFSGGEWEHYHRVSDHPDLMDYSKMARLALDLEQVLRRSDDADTSYHSPHDCTEFEVATLESVLGAEALAAVAARLGRLGYDTAEDLDAIVPALRGSLH